MPARLQEAEVEYTVEETNGEVKNNMEEMEEISGENNVSENEGVEMVETATTVDELSSNGEEDISSETVIESHIDDDAPKRYLSYMLCHQNKL